MTAAAKVCRPGWWYPYIYLGVFLVVLAVNLVFMFSAIRTFSGLEDQAYEKGLAYNKTLATAAAQKKLGWTTAAEVLSRGSHTADVVVSFHDKDGHALKGLDVKAEFVRPTVAGHDSSVQLVEQGEGRYVAVASLPFEGQWDMHVAARQGDVNYQFDKRIILR